MTLFYLAMYNFKIEINKNYVKLNEIPVNKEYRVNDSKHISFKDICNIIFNENKDKFISESLKVCEIKPSEDPYFSCKIGLAEYGNKRGVWDSEEDTEREPLEASDKVLEPFFFMFCTPYENNNEDGFFVIERKKSKPIIQKFKKMLKDKLKEINDNLRIEFTPHVPNELSIIVNEGIISEYIFTIYENEEDKIKREKLSTMKMTIREIEKKHPNNVDKQGLLDKVKQFFKNPHCIDNSFKMKVKHSDNQCATLDIDDMFNHKAFYLNITEDITTVHDNPTYDSMEETSKKYIKSNFEYYVKNNKSIFE